MSLYQIEKVLNIVPVILSGFSKVPQIRNGLKLKTTEGLSFVNLSIELYWYIDLFAIFWCQISDFQFLSWSVNVAYFVFHGYEFTDFLEYPLLLLQQIILISMHLKFNKIGSYPLIFGLMLVYLFGLKMMTLGPACLLQILIVSLKKNEIM